MPFKVGQKVKCIDDAPFGHDTGSPKKLSLGSVYTIQRHHHPDNNQSDIYLIGVEGPWSQRRFVLVDGGSEPECHCPNVWVHDTNCAWASWWQKKKGEGLK